MVVVRTAGPDGDRPIVIELDSVPDLDPTVADDYADVAVRGPRLDRLRTVGTDLLSDGLDLVRSCAERFSEAIDQMSEAVRPDEFEIQVAVKLDYEVGAILVAKGTAGAHLQATMRWKTSP